MMGIALIPHYHFFQFNNYKKSTPILAETFFRNIEENESKKMIKYFRWKGYEEFDENDIGTISSKEYGLYFPLLMLFRQSIELAFKLIFVNEILKKRTFITKEDFISKLSAFNGSLIL